MPIIFYTLPVEPESTKRCRVMADIPAKRKVYTSRADAIRAFHREKLVLWQGDTTYGPEMNKYLNVMAPAWLMAQDVDTVEQEITPDITQSRIVAGILPTNFPFKQSLTTEDELPGTISIRLKLIQSLNAKLAEKPEEFRRNFLQKKRKETKSCESS